MLQIAVTLHQAYFSSKFEYLLQKFRDKTKVHQNLSENFLEDEEVLIQHYWLFVNRKKDINISRTGAIYKIEIFQPINLL